MKPNNTMIVGVWAPSPKGFSYKNDMSTNKIENFVKKKYQIFCRKTHSFTNITGLDERIFSQIGKKMESQKGKLQYNQKL